MDQDEEKNPINSENLLPPPQLSAEQESLCERLDKWYAKYNLKVRPSDMFRGAVFASRPQYRSNPDWIAQSANSLRDILYPFGKENLPKKEKALKDYGSARAENPAFLQEFGRIFGMLTKIAHHGDQGGKVFTPEDFEKLLTDFEKVMGEALSGQVSIHAEIDVILGVDPQKITE